MNRTQIIRLFAGSLILISVFLSKFIHINWIWLSIFVGVNLLQSAFTKWCLLEIILIKLKIKGECEDRY